MRTWKGLPEVEAEQGPVAGLVGLQPEQPGSERTYVGGGGAVRRSIVR